MEQVGITEQIRTYLRPKGRGIKLHLGCGDYWFEGYLNIDYGVYGGTDMIYDCRQKLPFQDSVVEIIEAHDFFEHFSLQELKSMILDWYRLLIEGGQIILTLPDFDAVIEQYRNNKTEEFMRGVYGIDGEHKWGWTKESIKKFFEDNKFKNVTVQNVETGKDKVVRMELKCQK